MDFLPSNSIETQLWDVLPDKKGHRGQILWNNLILNSPLELSKSTLVP